MKNPTFEGMPQAYKDAFLKINPDKQALHSMYARDVARMQSFPDMKEEDIKGIKAPTLIIAGNKDVVRPEHVVEMYQQMQAAQLLILPGGHGDYIGEVTTVKPEVATYPALQIIETFLMENK
jgi:pimeloyl-ACP methyl ester carboxylesterase